MKRRLAMLLSAMAVATAVGVFAPVTPASANEVCAGQGVATITGGTLLYFDPTDTNMTGLGHATNAGFHFDFSTGTCTEKPNGFSADGMVSGWCGLSSGWGVTSNGHEFAWVGVGGTLLVTGHLMGVVNAVPDALNGESCTQPGADRFLVQGVVVLVHCDSELGEGDLILTDTPLLQFHVWVKPCVPGDLP